MWNIECGYLNVEHWFNGVTQMRNIEYGYTNERNIEWRLLELKKHWTGLQKRNIE